MQLSFLAPDSDWAPPTIFPELKGDVAWDLETRDPRLKELGPSWAFGEGEIVGVSVADEAGFNGYFPFNHQGGGNLDKHDVLNWTQAQIKKPGAKIFANAGYDVGWFERTGITFDHSLIEDIQLQAPLLDEHRWSYSLDALAKQHLGERKNNKLMNEAAAAFGFKRDEVGANLWRLASPFVGPYAADDSRLTLAVWKKQKKLIEEEGLQKVYDLERNLVGPLVQMRMRGVRVDIIKAQTSGAMLRGKRDEVLKEIHRRTGLRVDPWVAKSVAAALEHEGVVVPRTPKSDEPSVTKQFLKSLNTEGARLIASARRYDRAAMFADSILRHTVNGRLHCQFHQLRKTSDDGVSQGTVTGRMSSSDINMQQIPAPDRDAETSAILRGLFLPEEGELWGQFDYKGQEPRIQAHCAELAGVRGGAQIAQAYRDNPELSLHDWVAGMCALPKHDAKTINLGIAYGMGGAKLCRSLGLPTKTVQNRSGKNIEVAGDEGQKILDQYNEGAPFVKGCLEFFSNLARDRGYVRTLMGRRIRFPDGQFTHKAFNGVSQGTAADMTKLAMLELHKAGHKMTLQVHDELDASVSSPEVGAQISEIMCNALPLNVPVLVDVEMGDSWGTVK